MIWRGEHSGFGQSGSRLPGPLGPRQAEESWGPREAGGLGDRAEAGQAPRGRRKLLLFQLGGGARYGAGSVRCEPGGVLLRQGGDGHFLVQAERLQDGGPSVAMVHLRGGGVGEWGNFVDGGSEARAELL